MCIMGEFAGSVWRYRSGGTPGQGWIFANQTTMRVAARTTGVKSCFQGQAGEGHCHGPAPPMHKEMDWGE